MRKLAILVVLLSVFVPRAFGAGRIVLETPTTTGPAGTPLSVTIKLLQGDSPNAEPSTGEKAEVLVRDAKNGQSCTTDPAPSDNQGQVRATCTSDEPGTMVVYATSKDRGDSSADKTLEFTPKADPTQKADAPKAANTKQNPFIPQAQQPENNPGSTLANQPGLAEDRNTDPLQEGLTRSDSAAAGAADTSGSTAAPQSDIDLITSLIFLTGGIILLIGVIYLIYLQVKKNR